MMKSQFSYDIQDGNNPTKIPWKPKFPLKTNWALFLEIRAPQEPWDFLSTVCVLFGLLGFFVKQSPMEFP